MRRLVTLVVALSLPMGASVARAADDPKAGDDAARDPAVDKEMAKLEEALAAESEILAGDLAALDAALGRDLAPKVREKAEKMRAKRDAQGNAIARVKTDADAARARKDGAAKVRAALNQSKQRLVLLKMDSADVRKWVAKNAGVSGAAAGPREARPGVLASCEIPFTGGDKSQLELDGKPAVALPATVRVVSGRHHAVVRLDKATRPVDLFVVCGATESVAIPPP